MPTDYPTYPHLQGERTGRYTVSPVYARAGEIGAGVSL